MRLISWNLNGLRAVLRKDQFWSFVEADPAAVFCFQETKICAAEFSKIRGEFEKKGFSLAEAHAEKRGYSGVLTMSRTPPRAVKIGVGVAEFDAEGRTVATDHGDFWLVNAYFPNARDDLSRLDFRLDFDRAILDFCEKLRAEKPVILTGDLNVAHRAIDLRHPGPNRGKKGFNDAECGSFEKFLDAGFIDSLRAVRGDEPELFSWWSYRAGARKTNAGWRIDYFLVDKKISAKIAGAGILTEVFGSDHAPVFLEI